jgi:hypothetical protein
MGTGRTDHGTFDPADRGTSAALSSVRRLVTRRRYDGFRDERSATLEEGSPHE